MGRHRRDQGHVGGRAGRSAEGGRCRGLAGRLQGRAAGLLGRQHCLCGLLAGVGLVAVVPAAPWTVKILGVAVTGGAALLPDLDKPGSTAARSLGPITGLLARGVDRLSLTIYEATRLPGDPSGRTSGHRLWTHTPACSLLVGGVTGLLGVAHPVALAAWLGLLCGLLGLALRVAGFGLALAGGLLAWWVLTQDIGWSWLYAVAVTLGSHVHREGDWVTPAGVPRRLWPLPKNGRRWDMVSTPATFPAGGPVETGPVLFLIVIALVVSVASVTGLLPILVSAAVTAMP